MTEKEHKVNQNEINPELFMVHENEIYFGGEVNDESMLWFKQALHNAMHAAKMQDSLVELYISSPGGSVTSALGIVDIILSSPHIIKSTILGSAASAATLIACACFIREAYQNSTMLFHSLSMGAKGKFSQVQDNVYHGDMLHQKMVDIYFQNSHLSRKAINEMLARETYLTPMQAAKYGLIDTIIPSKPVERPFLKKIKRINKIEELK